MDGEGGDTRSVRPLDNALEYRMIRKFMTTVALGSLFVGGLAASHLAFAQDDAPQRGRHGGPMAMADADKDGNVTRAELTQALTARFARLDTNGDGKVTREEREASRAARTDARFDKVDADDNGQISKAEFEAGHDKRMGGGKHKRGHGGMKGGGFGGRADADKDGTLTREEYLAGPLALFDKADADKDGTVTAAEQQAARAAMRAAWQARKADAARK
jgi:hypothetical protein